MYKQTVKLKFGWFFQVSEVGWKKPVLKPEKNKKIISGVDNGK
jgi:hypothetical protein